MSGSTWRLALFGAPSLQHAERPDVPLSRKDAALLAVVALQGPLPPARLAAMLWPQASPAGAVNNLRQRLYRLRKASGARLVDVADSATPAADLATDLFPPRDALLADPWAWDGELLGAHDYDDHPELAAWLAPLRETWRQRRRDTLAGLAAEAEQQGDLARGLAYAQRLLRDDPLAEHAHRRLMRLHYLRGDRAAAVAAFERCEQGLKDELGLRPSDETLALLARVEAMGLAVPPSRAMPPTLSRPPRLVGRDAELTTLTAADAAQQVALLLGEAGLGKTRLLEELIAVRPALVYARARPGDAGLPWGLLTRVLREVLRRHPAAVPADPLRPLLARLLPELGPAAQGEGEGQRALLMHAVEQVLAAARRDGLAGLVVDDLHFADPASLESLRTLVDAGTERTGSWLLAQRPDELQLEAAPALQPLLEIPGLVLVRLAPLSLAAVRELLRTLELPGLDTEVMAAGLLQRTGGNPLFVLETLREMHVRAVGPDASGQEGSAWPGLPETVERLIEQRLLRLSPEALALARVAAVAGGDFSVALAERVMQSSALHLADAWRELEAAQLLKDLRFAHDLAQEAALRTLPGPIARVVHGQVAAFLEGQGGEPARLAWHWHGAGEPARAAPAYAEAAARARQVGRRDDEAALLDHAVAAYTAAGMSGEAFSARCARANAWAIGRGVGAAEAEIEALLHEAQGDLQQLAAQRVRTETVLFAKDAVAGLPVAESYLRLARRVGEPPTVALALTYVAQAMSVAGHHAEALARLDEVRAWVAAHGDAGLRYRFFSILTFALYNTGAAPEAEVATTAAAQAAREANDLSSLHEASSNLAMVRLSLGRADSAVEVAGQAAMLSETLGLGQVHRTMDRLNLGLCSLAAGHYQDAVNHLEGCANDATAPDALRSHARSMLAAAWMHLGQEARVPRLLAGDGLSDHAPHQMRAARLMVLRVGLVAVESVDDAHFPALIEVTAGMGNSLIGGMVQLERARSQGWAELAETAERLMRQLAHAQPPLATLARVARVEALAAMGQHDGAVAEARRALEALGGVAYSALYKPQLWWRLRCVLLALDSPELAARALADALAWISGTVLPPLPQAWRPSFLEANQVNRALLAAARAERSG